MKKNQDVSNLVDLINESGLFDKIFYERQYCFDSDQSINPFEHFITIGIKQNYSPNSLFDAEWYNTYYRSDIQEGMGAFEHYLLVGKLKNYSPNQYFDAQWYVEKYHDVADSGTDPFRHFIEYGEQEGRDPGPNFSTKLYYTVNTDVLAHNISALSHYINFGESEGRVRFPSRLTRPDAIPVPVVWGERRMIIVDATYPTPDRDSGSVDAINFIHIFQRLGYKVYFTATEDFDEYSVSPVAYRARSQLEAHGVVVLDSRYGQSPKDIIHMNGGYFRIYLLSRVYCGGEMYEFVRSHAPKSKIIFNTVDIHSLREFREAVLYNDRKAMFESYRVAEREYYLSRLSDATIVVSDQEEALLNQRVPGSNVFTVPLIREIPGRSRSFLERADIGFIGGFRHLPNVDGVKYFLDQIWPLIRLQLPEVQFLLMGADIPQELADRDDLGLRIVGHVEVLSEIFGQIRVSVAPLRYGAGAKGKVATSLVHGVPCVSSQIAAEGMGVGEASAVLIGDEPQTFADHVVKVYRDAALWDELSEKGLALMREKYSFAAGISKIESIISSICVSDHWDN